LEKIKGIKAVKCRKDSGIHCNLAVLQALHPWLLAESLEVWAMTPQKNYLRLQRHGLELDD
jgi:hypothetical protein